MKAVHCTRYGPPEALQIGEVPRPMAEEGEILVKIMATAVNSGDVRVRALAVEGAMKIVMRMVLGITKPRKPILGTVYAGIIEEVGAKVTRFKVGDGVFGMTGFSFGTYAEYITVKEKSNIAHMPAQATFEEAVSLIFGGQTAIFFLERAKLPEREDPKILIYGATGSVGSSAIQIAKHYGARVTAVCSSQGEALVRNLGVGDIILYDREEFTQTPKRFDCIFDAVGKTSKKQCAPLLKEGGIYKTVAGMEFASETQQQLLLLKELWEKDKLRAVIDRSYPLEQIVEAHCYVETGRKKGNVILRVSGPNGSPVPPPFPKK